MPENSSPVERPDADASRITVRPDEDVTAAVATLAGQCELTHEDDGRPVLRTLSAGPVAGVPPAVSLSHSGGLVAVAVAPTPIGVDLEVVRAFPAAAAIVMRRFAAAETAQWRDNGSDPTAFWWLWTRKEAVAKAVGVALPTALRADVRPATIRHGASPDHEASRALRLWTWLLSTSAGPAVLSAAVVDDDEGHAAARPTVSGTQSTPSADLPASNRATGTRNGEQDT